jgi:hypothetical protein
MGSRGIALLILNLGTRREWVVGTTPRPLYPRERPGTHCTGDWVGSRAGLDRCEKSLPTGIRFPDRPVRSSVAISTELPGPPWLLVTVWNRTYQSRAVSEGKMSIAGHEKDVCWLENYWGADMLLACSRLFLENQTVFRFVHNFTLSLN